MIRITLLTAALLQSAAHAGQRTPPPALEQLRVLTAQMPSAQPAVTAQPQAAAQAPLAFTCRPRQPGIQASLSFEIRALPFPEFEVSVRLSGADNQVYAQTSIVNFAQEWDYTNHLVTDIYQARILGETGSYVAMRIVHSVPARFEARVRSKLLGTEDAIPFLCKSL